MDDIAFIQISHPQDTTLPRDPNHLSNTLSQCVEQFFRALGEARRSFKKKNPLRDKSEPRKNVEKNAALQISQPSPTT